MAANTKAIDNRLITYFAWRLEKPKEWFTRNTPVREAFKYVEAWMALADYFNGTEWMKLLKVKISQKEIRPLKTIGQISDLIAKKAAGRLQLLPLTPSTDAERPFWLSVEARLSQAQSEKRKSLQTKKKGKK